MKLNNKNELIINKKDFEDVLSCILAAYLGVNLEKNHETPSFEEMQPKIHGASKFFGCATYLLFENFDTTLDELNRYQDAKKQFEKYIEKLEEESDAEV